jgi:hypothetical protein
MYCSAPIVDAVGLNKSSCADGVETGIPGGHVAASPPLPPPVLSEQIPPTPVDSNLSVHAKPTAGHLTQSSVEVPSRKTSTDKAKNEQEQASPVEDKSVFQESITLYAYFQQRGVKRLQILHVEVGTNWNKLVMPFFLSLSCVGLASFLTYVFFFALLLISWR